MAEIEGKNNNNANSKDELSNAFAALLASIIGEEIEETGEQYSDSYFTSIKSFFLTKSLAISHIIPYVKTLVDNLNN